MALKEALLPGVVFELSMRLLGVFGTSFPTGWLKASPETSVSLVHSLLLSASHCHPTYAGASSGFDPSCFVVGLTAAPLLCLESLVSLEVQEARREP